MVEHTSKAEIDSEVLIVLTSLIEYVDQLLIHTSKSDGLNNNIILTEEKEQANLESYTLLWCDASQFNR